MEGRNAVNSLYIILGAVIFLVIIFFVGKSYGKSIPPKENEIPSDDPTGTGGSSEKVITGITDEIYNDISGLTLFGSSRNFDAYVNLNSLSDADFVRVYNDWNNRYFSKDKETIRQAINNEIRFFFPFGLEGTLDSIENKFSRLNLK